MTEGKFFLLSLERSAEDPLRLVWWLPNERGYTESVQEAGIYTWDRAIALMTRSMGGDVALPLEGARMLVQARTFLGKVAHVKFHARETVAQCLEAHGVSGDAKFQAALVATGIALGSAIDTLRCFEVDGDADVSKIAAQPPICRFLPELKR